MKREKVISEIKKCMEDEQYSEGERLAGQALMQMPKSPALHNLMGLEKKDRENKCIQTHVGIGYCMVQQE